MTSRPHELGLTTAIASSMYIMLIEFVSSAFTSDVRQPTTEQHFDVSANLPGYNISSLLSGCKGQRAGLDAETQFACALGCSAEEKPLAQSLQPWSGVGKRMLEKTLWRDMCRKSQRYSQAFLATYRNGRLFWKCCSNDGLCEPTEVHGNGITTTDVELLLQVVLEVARAVGLPDMDFCFNTGDQPFTKRSDWPPVPQFHWVSSPSYWGVPMPNPFHLKALAFGRLGDSSGTLRESHLVWHQRDNRLFWRGVLSGPDNIIPAGMEAMPRLQLHRLAKAHPDLFDVAFNDFDSEIEVALGTDARSKHWTRIKNGLDVSDMNFVDFKQELPRRKYVINVSAVLSSWRLIELLASGALLFLQEDADREVVRDWLVPWEHFVPVRYELSDLVPKLRWFREHDAEARKIAERGFQRFAERVRQEDTQCYVWRALRAVSHIAGPDVGNRAGFQEFTLRDELRAPGRRPLLEEIQAWRQQQHQTSEQPVGRLRTMEL